MSKDFEKQKKRQLSSCAYGCLTFLIISLFLIFIVWFVCACVSESTIFLKTENITLVNTFTYCTKELVAFLKDDPRVICYLEKNNKTSVIFKLPGPGTIAKEIILKKSDDFLVLLKTTRSGGININPKESFRRESRFYFYRIKKEIKDDKLLVAKIEFLGSLETNLYGEWGKIPPHRISISPDGKYIVMSAHAVDSRAHGEYRNKDVLLIWEIGENVVEKDIVDGTGKKIPIIVKTEEELERR